MDKKIVKFLAENSQHNLCTVFQIGGRSLTASHIVKQ